MLRRYRGDDARSRHRFGPEAALGQPGTPNELAPAFQVWLGAAGAAGGEGDGHDVIRGDLRGYFPRIGGGAEARFDERVVQAKAVGIGGERFLDHLLDPARRQQIRLAANADGSEGDEKGVAVRAEVNCKRVIGKGFGNGADICEKLLAEDRPPATPGERRVPDDRL